MYTEEDEKRMDIIGQNGNDGTHYEEDSVSDSEKIPEVSEPNTKEVREKVKLEKGAFSRKY